MTTRTTALLALLMAISLSACVQDSSPAVGFDAVEGSLVTSSTYHTEAGAFEVQFTVDQQAPAGFDIEALPGLIQVVPTAQTTQLPSWLTVDVYPMAQDSAANWQFKPGASLEDAFDLEPTAALQTNLTNDINSNGWEPPGRQGTPQDSPNIVFHPNTTQLELNTDLQLTKKEKDSLETFNPDDYDTQRPRKPRGRKKHH